MCYIYDILNDKYGVVVKYLKNETKHLASEV